MPFNVADDIPRRFRVGIVACQNRKIGMLRGGDPKLTPADFSTSADRTEKTDKPARLVSAQRSERRGKAFSVVRIIDDEDDGGKRRFTISNRPFTATSRSAAAEL